MSTLSPLANRASQAAFTLIELIVSIVVASIVVSFMTMFIVGPVNIYSAQARRAEMVDAADGVLRTMGRDIRRALPNSIRTAVNGSYTSVTLLATVDATRYLDTGSTSADELDFTSSDKQFATIGQFDDIPTRPWCSTAYYLSIYNVGIPGADAYERTNVITPVGTKICIDNGLPGEDRVTLDFTGTADLNFKFTYGSPARRVYLVSGPVTYLCDSSAHTIKRYSGFGIPTSLTLLTTPSGLATAGATASLIANDLKTCVFTYSPGTAQRAGLMTLDVALERAVTGGTTEQVRLLNQLHVENAP